MFDLLLADSSRRSSLTRGCVLRWCEADGQKPEEVP
jgi:hypothetical protein